MIIGWKTEGVSGVRCLACGPAGEAKGKSVHVITSCVRAEEECSLCHGLLACDVLKRLNKWDTVTMYHSNRIRFTFRREGGDKVTADIHNGANCILSAWGTICEVRATLIRYILKGEVR